MASPVDVPLRLGLSTNVKSFTPSRSEEHTSDSSHMSNSYAVFCLKKKSDVPTSARRASPGRFKRMLGGITDGGLRFLRLCFMVRHSPLVTLFPYSTLFRSQRH